MAKRKRKASGGLNAPSFGGLGGGGGLAKKFQDMQQQMVEACNGRSNCTLPTELLLQKCKRTSRRIKTTYTCECKLYYRRVS